MPASVSPPPSPTPSPLSALASPTPSSARDCPFALPSSLCPSSDASPPRTPPPSLTPPLNGADRAIRENLLGPRAAIFSDVTLLSSDSQSIPAVRALLAIRSPYFENLFFATFAERNAKSVSLSFCASTIRHVVQFCYTDTCHVLSPPRECASPPRKRARTSGGETKLDNVRVSALMDLALAADYLHILPLLSRVCSALRDIMRAHPHIACDILQTFSDVPSSPQFSRLLDAAVSAIRQRPAHALLVDDMESGFTRPVCGTSGVLCLQENTLRRLLNDNDLFTSECYLFQVLFCWASCGYSLSLMSNKAGARRIEGADIFYAPGNVTGAEWDNVRNSERWNAGKRLLKCIDLERLKPSFIRDFVRRSGLASVELLCTTFENQALEAERGRALYDNLRGGSTWPHGGKTLCATTGGSVGKNYTLRAPWLQNGRHEWTFRIVKLATCFWLGFATTVPTIGPVYTHGSAAWAISGDGRAIEPHQEGGKGTITGPRLKEGKTVRLVLNLIKSGTVTVMVEGDSRTYGMFRELLSRGSSFCLVACLNAPGCIELIGEQHLLST